MLKNADETGGPAAVGLETLQDLRGYSFRELRKLVFEFFYPTINSADEIRDLPFTVNITELNVFKRSGVYGLDRVHRSIADINHRQYRKKELAPKPTPIGSKGKMLSFLELNRKIDRALNPLSKDWNAKTKAALAI